MKFISLALLLFVLAHLQAQADYYSPAVNWRLVLTDFGVQIC
ncbi:MAG: hypothetical protein V2B15_07835 [Bacteroidota bacterium]